MLCLCSPAEAIRSLVLPEATTVWALRLLYAASCECCCSLCFLFRYGRKIGDSVELQETQGIAYGVARVVIGWSQAS